MYKIVLRNIIGLSVLYVVFISGCEKQEGGTTVAAPETACWIDAINGAPASEVSKVKIPTIITISGWAVDKKNGTVPTEVGIELLSPDGRQTVTVSASRGTQRPDVAKAFNNPAFKDAGFDSRVTINDKVAPGRYSIRVIQKSGTSKFSCETQKFVEVSK